MKNGQRGREPLELDFDDLPVAESPVEISLEFDADGGSGDGEEILSFDPFGVEGPAPAVRQPPGKLELNFRDVLGEEEASRARRAGEGRLDNRQFYSREEREAAERAVQISRGAPTTNIELEEERRGAVRVVAEGRAIWIWFGLLIAALLVVVAGAAWGFHRANQLRENEELQRLLDADKKHQEAEMDRTKHLAR